MPPKKLSASPQRQDQASFLLRIEEACERLRCGRSTLYQLMDAGKIGYVRLGSDRRIPESAIADYIAKNLVGGNL